MNLTENTAIAAQIERIPNYSRHADDTHWILEAAALAQSILYETMGRNHPLISVLDNVLKSGNSFPAVGVIRGIVALYDDGMLPSPRLAIAHEIEGDILDVAQERVQAADRTSDGSQKQIQLAIGAFLAGAALEDALRRICDAGNIGYNPQKTTISTLQNALYQPSNNIEVISKSENKQITAWGETRNNADHGRFSTFTVTEVLTMVLGVRGFIDNHLP